MIVNLRELSTPKRRERVEEVRDRIAEEHSALPLSDEQKSELDRRLELFKQDGVKGRPASEAVRDIRRRL